MPNLPAQNAGRPSDRDLDWLKHAICANVHPDTFTGPFGPTGVRTAKAICSMCPVRTDCLEFALASDSARGVWGGLTQNERRKLQAERRKRAG